MPVCPTRMRDDAPDLRCIAVAVAGDMAQQGLGLAATAAAALAADVDIVLHCAASIAFDAPVQTLLATNYEARPLQHPRIAREFAMCPCRRCWPPAMRRAPCGILSLLRVCSCRGHDPCRWRRA